VGIRYNVIRVYPLFWSTKSGEDAGACSDFPTGWPGIAIAVPPGSAHSPRGVIFKTKVNQISKLLGVEITHLSGLA